MEVTVYNQRLEAYAYNTGVPIQAIDRLTESEQEALLEGYGAVLDSSEDDDFEMDFNEDDRNDNDFFPEDPTDAPNNED